MEIYHISKHIPLKCRGEIDCEGYLVVLCGYFDVSIVQNFDLVFLLDEVFSHFFQFLGSPH
jgi:hypothetical protein